MRENPRIDHAQYILGLRRSRPARSTLRYTPTMVTLRGRGAQQARSCRPPRDLPAVCAPGCVAASGQRTIAARNTRQVQIDQRRARRPPRSSLTPVPCVAWPAARQQSLCDDRDAAYGEQRRRHIVGSRNTALRRSSRTIAYSKRRAPRSAPPKQYREDRGWVCASQGGALAVGAKGNRAALGTTAHPTAGQKDCRFTASVPLERAARRAEVCRSASTSTGSFECVSLLGLTPVPAPPPRRRARPRRSRRVLLPRRARWLPGEGESPTR